MLTDRIRFWSRSQQPRIFLVMKYTLREKKEQTRDFDSLRVDILLQNIGEKLGDRFPAETRSPMPEVFGGKAPGDRLQRFVNLDDQWQKNMLNPKTQIGGTENLIWHSELSQKNGEQKNHNLWRSHLAKGKIAKNVGIRMQSKFHNSVRYPIHHSRGTNPTGQSEQSSDNPVSGHAADRKSGASM